MNGYNNASQNKITLKWLDRLDNLSERQHRFDIKIVMLD